MTDYDIYADTAWATLHDADGSIAAGPFDTLDELNDAIRGDDTLAARRMNRDDIQLVVEYRSAANAGKAPDLDAPRGGSTSGMPPAEHYREAERLLHDASAGEHTGHQVERYAVAIAQVHATLATAGDALRVEELRHTLDMTDAELQATQRTTCDGSVTCRAENHVEIPRDGGRADQEQIKRVADRIYWEEHGGEIVLDDEDPDAQTHYYAIAGAVLDQLRGGEQ